MIWTSCAGSAGWWTSSSAGNDCAPAMVLPRDELARMRTMEVALDRCGDVLRQRRARGAAGADLDAVVVRPDAMVEGYEP